MDEQVLRSLHDTRHLRGFFRDFSTVSPGLTNANVPEYVTNVSIC